MKLFPSHRLHPIKYLFFLVSIGLLLLSPNLTGCTRMIDIVVQNNYPFPINCYKIGPNTSGKITAFFMGRVQADRTEELNYVLEDRLKT